MLKDLAQAGWIGTPTQGFVRVAPKKFFQVTIDGKGYHTNDAGMLWPERTSLW
ncbi:MAG TPA: hypothetical protein VGK74_12720 [Symbiobacteriaceae bacterium]|jgi:hypothetical protein